MPTAAVRYGTIHFGDSAWSAALTAPVDDVLAAGELAAASRGDALPAGAHRAVAIARRYAEVALFPVPLDDPDRLWRDLLAARPHGVVGALQLADRTGAAERVLRYFDRLHADGIPDLFLRAAGLGQEARVSAELAPYLERLTFRSGGVEAPTWIELAAWSLDTAVRAGVRFTVDTCALCDAPWLRTGATRYCKRVAPHAWQTCAQIAKVREHRARKRAFLQTHDGDETSKRQRRRGS